MKINKLLTMILLALSSLSALEIYPQVSAKIIYIKQVGDTVKKGEILVKLDARQINAKIQAQKAKVNYLSTLLADKELTLEQNTELYNSTVLPKRALDDITLDTKLVRSQYAQEKANLEYLQLEREKYAITSPINGTIKEILYPRNVTNALTPKPLLSVE